MVIRGGLCRDTSVGLNTPGGARLEIGLRLILDIDSLNCEMTVGELRR